VLELLRSEYSLALGLIGCPHSHQLNRHYISS